MASKLDQALADLAIVISSHDWTQILTTAPQIAAGIPDPQIPKLPDRWFPKLSAKAAGTTRPDSWGRDWFEALAEVLFQKGTAGIPPLCELWERDKSTYLDLVGMRLLRLAAQGIASQEIEDRLAARLPQFHVTAINQLASQVVHFSLHDPLPLTLFRKFSDIAVKNQPGVTVGAYIAQHESEIQQ